VNTTSDNSYIVSSVQSTSTPVGCGTAIGRICIT